VLIISLAPSDDDVPRSCAPRCGRLHGRRPPATHRLDRILVATSGRETRHEHYLRAAGTPGSPSLATLPEPLPLQLQPRPPSGYREAHEAAGCPCGRSTLWGEHDAARSAAAGRRRCWPCPSRPTRSWPPATTQSFGVMRAARRAGTGASRRDSPVISGNDDIRRWREVPSGLTTVRPPVGGRGPARMDACSILVRGPGRRRPLHLGSSRPSRCPEAPQAAAHGTFRLHLLPLVRALVSGVRPPLLGRMRHALQRGGSEPASRPSGSS